MFPRTLAAWCRVSLFSALCACNARPHAASDGNPSAQVDLSRIPVPKLEELTLPPQLDLVVTDHAVLLQGSPLDPSALAARLQSCVAEDCQLRISAGFGVSTDAARSLVAKARAAGVTRFAIDTPAEPTP